MNRVASAWLAAAALVALGGCKGKPYVNAHIESLNTEFRQLEDYVYALEEENDRLQEENDLIRAGRLPAERNAPRPRGGAFLDPANDAPASTPPDLRPRVGDPPRITDPPVIDIPAAPREAQPARVPPRTVPPGLEAPGPGPSDPRPSIRNRPLSNPPEQRGLNLVPPATGVPESADELPTPAASPSSPPEPIHSKPVDSHVTHLFINPVLTGGSDFDARPGDEGLNVVLEPRNAADELVSQPGAVSVVVLDPSKAGDAARIARWDFDISTTRQKMQSASAAQGIQLQLPWPSTPPSSKNLHLFVRYETADGRKLQADREIFISTEERVAERWTPRTRPSLPVTTSASPQPHAGSQEKRLSPAPWSPSR